MGHKGVSKRKTPKQKTQPVSKASTIGELITGPNAVETPKARMIGKGEAISIVKGGKKKSSDSVQKKKKQ